jgi:hypothetical protein
MRKGGAYGKSLTTKSAKAVTAGPPPMERKPTFRQVGGELVNTTALVILYHQQHFRIG